MIIKSYKIKPVNSRDSKAEFRGIIIFAPTEDEAWRILFGMSGEYGTPEEDQYELVENGKACDFDGDIESWREAVLAGDALSSSADYEYAAKILGRKGGSVKSEKKAAAVRENGKRGGRPRKAQYFFLSGRLKSCSKKPSKRRSNNDRLPMAKAGRR